VAVNALKGVINQTIRQPDPERKAICYSSLIPRPCG